MLKYFLKKLNSYTLPYSQVSLILVGFLTSPPKLWKMLLLIIFVISLVLTSLIWANSFLGKDFIRCCCNYFQFLYLLQSVLHISMVDLDFSLLLLFPCTELSVGSWVFFLRVLRVSWRSQAHMIVFNEIVALLWEIAKE